MSKKPSERDFKEHTDDPARTHPGQQIDPEGGPPAPEGQYHGLTPEQVEKIEAARGDNEPSVPPEPGPPPDFTVPDPNAPPPAPEEDPDTRTRR